MLFGQSAGTARRARLLLCGEQNAAMRRVLAGALGAFLRRVLGDAVGVFSRHGGPPGRASGGFGGGQEGLREGQSFSCARAGTLGFAPSIFAVVFC